MGSNPSYLLKSFLLYIVLPTCLLILHAMIFLFVYVADSFNRNFLENTATKVRLFLDRSSTIFSWLKFIVTFSWCYILLYIKWNWVNWRSCNCNLKTNGLYHGSGSSFNWHTIFSILHLWWLSYLYFAESFNRNFLENVFLPYMACLWCRAMPKRLRNIWQLFLFLLDEGI